MNCRIAGAPERVAVGIRLESLRALQSCFCEYLGNLRNLRSLQNVKFRSSKVQTGFLAVLLCPASICWPFKLQCLLKQTIVARHRMETLHVVEDLNPISVTVSAYDGWQWLRASSKGFSFPIRQTTSI